MRFELCLKKTKCKECGKSMKKGEIRSVEGQGYYNDPIIYKCLECSSDASVAPLNSLIKIYKLQIKDLEKKIQKINELKKEIT